MVTSREKYDGMRYWEEKMIMSMKSTEAKDMEVLEKRVKMRVEDKIAYEPVKFTIPYHVSYLAKNFSVVFTKKSFIADFVPAKSELMISAMETMWKKSALSKLDYSINKPNICYRSNSEIEIL